MAVHLPDNTPVHRVSVRPKFVANSKVVVNSLGQRQPGQGAMGRAFVTVVGLVWLGASVAGLGSLWRYDATPGPVGASPTRLPLQIGGSFARIAILYMFVHPRCPCSRASIAELDRLMARCDDRLRAEVYFYKPSAAPEGWEKTDLWRSAAAIPGVHVHSDTAGVEARRLQARTSGETMLYAADGRLLFHGGITWARGHSGDNAGSAAVISVLQTGRAPITTAPVFGCSLLGPLSDGKSGEE